MFRLSIQKVRSAAVVALLLSILILAACGGAGPTELTIVASEYAFEVPEEIPAGTVSIRLENTGQEPHHAQLARLNDGVTMDQFMAALQAGETEALALISLEGGPGVVAPGTTSTATTSNLRPGQYVVLCFVGDPEGVPHLAHGMIATINVTGEPEVQEVEADGTVQLADFSITLPENLEANQVWEIDNGGQQPHELAFIQLAEGATMDDVAAFFTAPPSGPPPFTFAGGLQGIMPGSTAYLETDFEPGNYVALCFIPDPATGEAHALLGMVTPFTIP